MAGKLTRTLASILFLASLMGLIALFGNLDIFVPEVAAVASSGPLIGEYHTKDRAGTSYSGDYPHGPEVENAAFLNLHLRAMECSPCHMKGRSSYVKRLESGKLALSRKVREGLWVEVLESDDDVAKRKVPLDCKTCHRRRSQILGGLYSGPRLRVLEDLSVLRYLGRR
ncbi:MAG: hypothetical protein C0608_00130 [Deltaproteobacteria bacterium]|nr:MAG: hypothetical protein C0608_00130 [Deltaproteobacteria bacterium]